MSTSSAERAARRIADESCKTPTGIVPVPKMAAIIREELEREAIPHQEEYNDLNVERYHEIQELRRQLSSAQQKGEGHGR